jgi:hypothetical protein
MTDSPDPNETLVKIFDAEHESEAQVVKGLLDAAGIDAAQETFPGVGGVVLRVRSEDAEDARRVIADSQRSGL